MYSVKTGSKCFLDKKVIDANFSRSMVQKLTCTGIHSHCTADITLNPNALDWQNGMPNFQRITNFILWSVKGQFALAYLNNIVIFCKTLNLHIHHVCKFFLFFYNARGPLKHKKCNYFTNAINYWCHVIRFRWWELEPHTTGFLRGLDPLTRNTKLGFFQA